MRTRRIQFVVVLTVVLSLQGRRAGVPGPLLPQSRELRAVRYVERPTLGAVRVAGELRLLTILAQLSDRGRQVVVAVDEDSLLLIDRARQQILVRDPLTPGRGHPELIVPPLEQAHLISRGDLHVAICLANQLAIISVGSLSRRVWRLCDGELVYDDPELWQQLSASPRGHWVFIESQELLLRGDGGAQTRLSEILQPGEHLRDFRFLGERGVALLVDREERLVLIAASLEGPRRARRTLPAAWHSNSLHAVFWGPEAVLALPLRLITMTESRDGLIEIPVATPSGHADAHIDPWTGSGWLSYR